jgi:acetolactate synthase I/II/III large subunit
VSAEETNERKSEGVLMYTASTAMLEALQEAGVSYIFANFGSDHPALVEAIAEARAHGRQIPAVVTCPNEMVAMSCAHGYAQMTGRAQAVVVHVECGTQSLGGAVHNAAKGRIPIFIFAGLSPFTQEGEMTGSRNEFIQWIQDVYDQRGIVRQYMKYDNEFRTGRNIKQIVHRSMQFSLSDPKGPVYLVGAREVMEEEAPNVAIDVADWSPIAPTPLAADAVETLADAFQKAERPLVVTSYLGRNRTAVEELVRFCNRLGVGVLESVPNYVNYPHDDELYQGNHWNHPFQNAALADADLVLVIDSDVPWIPTINKPGDRASIYMLDVDPLKESMPLWYIKAKGSYRADAATSLTQLNAHLDRIGVDAEAAERRRRHYGQKHRLRATELARLEAPGEIITPEFLTACVRRHVDMDTVIVNEGITNYPAICDHMARQKPGTMFTSGGGSLGWNGGAAIGMKLAAPDKTFVALTGDGSYMFSAPSTVHWMARQYRTPFLQVVYNNRGWKAPKYSALAVHPHGYASRADDVDTSFDPPPDYSAIAAAAGGAFARIVRRPEEVEVAIAEGLRIVREEKRCAVLDVWLPHL